MESTGHRWIPLTKASDAELWCFSLIRVYANGWANNRDAGDLRRHRAHYVVTVMDLYGNNTLEQGMSTPVRVRLPVYPV